MILITDSNIIFSALLKPESLIAKIIREEKKFQFFAPDYLLVEFDRYRQIIEEKSNFTPNGFREEWAYFFRNEFPIMERFITNFCSRNIKKFSFRIDQRNF